MRAAALALALVLLVVPGVPRADWRIEKEGCVEFWTRAEVARGPLAIGNGALLPVRSVVGGLTINAVTCRSWSCLWEAPLWLVSSTLWGAAEGTWWVVTGALDTVSGGALLISPAASQDLALYPLVPFLHRDSKENRCDALVPEDSSTPRRTSSSTPSGSGESKGTGTLP